jgi:hypothetical protein
MLSGGLTGAVIGGALPVVTGAASMAASPFVDAFKGNVFPKRVAEREVARIDAANASASQGGAKIERLSPGEMRSHPEALVLDTLGGPGGQAARAAATAVRRRGLICCIGSVSAASSKRRG